MRKLTVLFIIVQMMLCLAACGSDGSKKETISEEKAMKLVESIKNTDAFDSKLMQVDNNVIAQSYKISDDNIQVLLGYMGDGVSAEEITVLKGDSKDIKELTEAYIQEKSSSYKDYLPVESEKVDNAIVKQYGNITIICVCKDSKVIEDILK